MTAEKVAPGQACPKGTCTLGTCGGLYDYDGPCGGCCGCLSDCLNVGPEPEELDLTPHVAEVRDTECGCPSRPIGHGLVARVPDPECPVPGHGTPTDELDLAKEREA